MKKIEKGPLSASECVFNGKSSFFGSLAYSHKVTQLTACELFKCLFPNCYIVSY